MKRTLAVWTLPAIIALLGQGVGAQEEGAAPWSLKLSAQPLKVVTVTYKSGGARSFYYFTFTLTNSSQAKARLALHVRAIVGTDKLKQKTHVAMPEPDAEEFVRRMGRAPNLKNVQQINKMGALEPGESVQGIAVLGTFNREWDKATVLFTGLEAASLRCRVRKYGSAGFTVFHRAYHEHNKRVLATVSKGAAYTEVDAILQHDIVWKMVYFRKGDEFAPHMDPIYIETAGWDVLNPKIIAELKPPMSG